jgi:hypothetical protein
VKNLFQNLPFKCNLHRYSMALNAASSSSGQAPFSPLSKSYAPVSNDKAPSLAAVVSAKKFLNKLSSKSSSRRRGLSLEVRGCTAVKSSS